MHFLETLEILVSKEATNHPNNSHNSPVWPNNLDLEAATPLTKRTLPTFGTNLRVNLRVNLKASLSSPKKMLPNRTSPRISLQRRRRG